MTSQKYGCFFLFRLGSSRLNNDKTLRKSLMQEVPLGYPRLTINFSFLLFLRTIRFAVIINNISMENL